MTTYFFVGDVFDQITKHGGDSDLTAILAPVSKTIPEKRVPPEDVFTLAGNPNLLDTNDVYAAEKLAHLVENVPLYHLNLEMTLDDALTERHKNRLVREALEHAFGGGALPNTLTVTTEESDPSRPAASLRHPVLGHLESDQMASTYIRFIKTLGNNGGNYNLGTRIIGRQIEPFLRHFDGYFCGNDGAIRVSLLIGFGIRQDHDPAHTLSSQIEAGKMRAQAMGITDERELLWAWLESDHYQLRRCKDLDRVLRIQGLGRHPNWVKSDILGILERESMKQYFAERIVKSPTALQLLDKAPLLKKAILSDSNNEVDESLQQILSQTVNANSAYSGAAGAYAEKITQREQQARSAGIV
jgi:hypothetical protein